MSHVLCSDVACVWSGAGSALSRSALVRSVRSLVLYRQRLDRTVHYRTLSSIDLRQRNRGGDRQDGQERAAVARSVTTAPG